MHVERRHGTRATQSFHFNGLAIKNNISNNWLALSFKKNYWLLKKTINDLRKEGECMGRACHVDCQRGIFAGGQGK